jgi:signal transduction histidine kinase
MKRSIALNKPAAIGAVLSVIVLLGTIVFDLARQLKQIDRQQEQIVEIGETYGDMMWRVTSARSWWLEYEALLLVCKAKHEFPDNAQIKHLYQMFDQNIQAATRLKSHFVEDALEALQALEEVGDRAQALHQRLLAEKAITDPALSSASDISDELAELASQLSTFKYAYFGPNGVLEQTRRGLMYRSFALLAGVFFLTASAAIIYRNGLIREQQAKHSKLEALGALAAGYSHAISSIVGGLKIIVDTVRPNVSDPAQIETFDQLNIGLQRLRGLNKNLNTIARGNPANDTLAPIGEVLESLTSNPDSQIQITVRKDSTITGLHIPRLSISMIALEMISNAKSHRSPDRSPVIQISATMKDNDTLRLTFEDNGIGIKPRNISKVLDPFFSTTGEGHAGLGLTSVKAMVASMGGDISVQNRQTQQGAIFAIDLPVSMGQVPIPTTS